MIKRVDPRNHHHFGPKVIWIPSQIIVGLVRFVGSEGRLKPGLGIGSNKKPPPEGLSDEVDHSDAQTCITVIRTGLSLHHVLRGMRFTMRVSNFYLSYSRRRITQRIRLSCEIMYNEAQHIERYQENRHPPRRNRRLSLSLSRMTTRPWIWNPDA